ncbi:hypothetical protein N7537_003456, partial [Penicillium hordei]
LSTYNVTKSLNNGGLAEWLRRLTRYVTSPSILHLFTPNTNSPPEINSIRGRMFESCSRRVSFFCFFLFNHLMFYYPPLKAVFSPLQQSTYVR